MACLERFGRHGVLRADGCWASGRAGGAATPASTNLLSSLLPFHLSTCPAFAMGRLFSPHACLFPHTLTAATFLSVCHACHAFCPACPLDLTTQHAARPLLPAGRTAGGWDSGRTGSRLDMAGISSEARRTNCDFRHSKTTIGKHTTLTWAHT